MSTDGGGQKAASGERRAANAEKPHADVPGSPPLFSDHSPLAAARHPPLSSSPAGIGLGSNLGDRLENLRRARRSVVACLLPGDAHHLRSGPVFETEPVGCEPGAGRFLNTVIQVRWTGEPDALFEALQRIERELGRPADHPRNHSRVIDLDLLYVGECLRRDDSRLTLPHPRLRERRFVLAPLAAICPDLRPPGWREETVSARLRALDATDPGASLEPFLTEW